VHLPVRITVIVNMAGVCDAGHDGGLFVRQPGGDRTGVRLRVSVAARGRCVRRQRSYLPRAQTRAPRHRGTREAHS